MHRQRIVLAQRSRLLVDLVELTVDTLLDDTAENRAARAVQVRKASVDYFNQYMQVVDVGSSASFPNYVHEIGSHLHMYIEHHGPNISQMSGQGLEHLNKLGQWILWGGAYDQETVDQALTTYTEHGRE